MNDLPSYLASSTQFDDSNEIQTNAYTSSSFSDVDSNLEQMDDEDESSNDSDSVSSPDLSGTSSVLAHSATIECANSPKKFSATMPTIKLKLVNILTNSNQQLLQDIIRKSIATLRSKDAYGFFLVPVDTSIVTDYLSVIKNPMDLQTMEYKNDRNGYSSFSQLQEDLELICSNAMTYNAPNTVYYKSAQKLLTFGRKFLKRESLRFNDRLIKLAYKKPTSLGSSKISSATPRRKYRHYDRSFVTSLYEQAQLELATKGNLLPTTTKKVLEAKISLFKKCPDGSWIFSSRNRKRIPSICYNSDGSLNIEHDKEIRELLLGPFHDKIFCSENIPLLGPSSQILSSIINKNSTVSLPGRPTSSFWSGNGVPNFYDSMGYPIEDFISPSLCLAYGDPKGKEFIKKILQMGLNSVNQTDEVDSTWISSKLQSLVDDMTLGGHSFMTCIESFKDSVSKSTRVSKQKTENGVFSYTNVDVPSSAKHPPALLLENTYDEKPSFLATNSISTSDTTPNSNDRLLLEISSLLLITNEVKSQLLYAGSSDVSLTSRLSALILEIKDKLTQVIKLCSPSDLLGPRMDSIRQFMKDLTTEPIQPYFTGTLSRAPIQ